MNGERGDCGGDAGEPSGALAEPAPSEDRRQNRSGSATYRAERARRRFAGSHQQHPPVEQPVIEGRVHISGGGARDGVERLDGKRNR
jgi:hypothetical protein